MVSDEAVSSKVSVNGAMRTDIHLEFIGSLMLYAFPQDEREQF
jgi:hypothetical protein